MNVSLHPEMQRFIEDKVKSGQYATPEDVVNSALATLKAQEAQSDEDVEELRRLIRVGVEQLDCGESAPWNPEDLKRRVRDRAAKEETGMGETGRGETVGV